MHPAGVVLGADESRRPDLLCLGTEEEANNFYQMFITWTNQKIRNTFVQRNLFDFKHIKPFDRSYIDNPGAMVVFATPGTFPFLLLSGYVGGGILGNIFR